jgi:hypothetical protein
MSEFFDLNREAMTQSMLPAACFSVDNAIRCFADFTKIPGNTSARRISMLSTLRFASSRIVGRLPADFPARLRVGGLKQYLASLNVRGEEAQSILHWLPDTLSSRLDPPDCARSLTLGSLRLRPPDLRCPS